MKLKTSLRVSSPKEHSDLMAEVAIRIAEKKKYRSILDMGTGTGYIALLLNEKGFKTDGCDVSDSAVKLSRENCVGKDIKIFQSDLFRNVKDKYDLVLFNPPASGKAGESQIGNLLRGTFLRKPLAAIFYKLSSKNRINLITRFMKEAQRSLNRKGMILVYLNPEEIKLMNKRFKKIYKIFIISHRKMANNLTIMAGELK